MQAATGDIESIQQTITDIVAACNQADTTGVQLDAATDLPALGQTLGSLLDVMQRVQGDAGSSATEDVLGLQTQKSALVDLFLSIGLWIAHQGGLIDTLEPIVDAVAMSANHSRSPQELEALSDVIRQIIDAVPATISQDLETLNPGRPWRVLLLNHCIVATRSHDPERMERAFVLLTEHLPGDAPRFFSEGMQQMEALDYPDQVRTLIEKYHRKWNIDRSLH